VSRKKVTEVGTFLGFSARLRKIRGKLSQGAFGKVLGVTKVTISRYEAGRIPDVKTLSIIANYGGVSVEWLLHGDKTAELPELPESMTIESPPPGAGPGIHDPYLFGGVDIDAMSQIIELVEDHLSHRQRPLKNVKKALLLSLLYDRFQTTGQIPGQATLKEFLRRVD
jgi:transcriptional regulator with XRE-family HTH domain